MNSPSFFSAVLALGLLTLGAGGLRAASFTLESDSEFIINGDFNADGMMDVVIVDRQTGILRVMQGAASGRLSALTSLYTGVDQPAFASAGRVGDGSSTVPRHDSVLLGSPAANRAVLVAPRLPQTPARAIHELGVAPQAAAVVPLPNTVSGNTAHEDIIGRAAGERSRFADPSAAAGVLREWLNKGTALTARLEAEAPKELASLNAVMINTGTNARTLLAGLAMGDTTFGESNQLLLMVPGGMAYDEATATLSGVQQMPISASRPRYVAGIFGGSSTATFVIYEQGESKIELVAVTAGSGADQPPFVLGDPQADDLGAAVLSLCVIQGKAGTTQLAVAFEDGSVEIRSVESTDGVLSTRVVSSLPAQQALSGLVAGPKGVLHLLQADAATGRSQSVISMADDGTSWKPIAGAAVALPVASDLASTANVLVFDKAPFLNSEPRMLGAYRAGDWTAALALSGSGLSLTGSATAETFQSPVLGLGAASAVSLGAVPGVASGPPGQLVNQVSDQVSVFSLEPARGELVDVVTADPPSGSYPGLVKLTLTAAGSSPIFFRRAANEAFELYSSPLWISQSCSVEFYAQNAAGRRSSIGSRSYVLPEDAAELDSDGDGLPDFVEVANGLDPSAGPDTDGDGFSDLAELLAGTNPNDSASRPNEGMLLPTDSRVELAVTPRSDRVDGSRVAAEGTQVSAHNLGGSLLASALVAPAVGSGLPEAELALALPVGQSPIIGLGTSGNFETVSATSTPGDLPQQHPELVGLVPLTRPAPLRVTIELNAFPDTPELLSDKASQWLELYKQAWEESRQLNRLQRDLSLLDTMALLLLEEKVTQVMLARGMLSSGQRVNLTPWRGRRDASLVTPTAAQWRQLEQYDAAAPQQSLLVADTLQNIYTLIAAAQDTPTMQMVRVFAERIYSLAANRQSLEPMIVARVDPTDETSALRDPTGSIGAPVDVLRHFVANGALPAADAKQFWGIAALAASNDDAAGVMEAQGQVSVALQALLGGLSQRPVVTLNLRVPEADEFPELVGLDGLFMIARNDSNTADIVHQLVDAEGRDYETTKGLRLPTGARFIVTAFSDLRPALQQTAVYPLEVISIRWVGSSLQDIVAPEIPVAPTILGLEATNPPGSELLDVSKPLLVLEGQSLKLKVLVDEAKAADWTFQWRRNGTAIDGARDTELVLATSSTSFDGYYDVEVSSAGGRSVSPGATAKVQRIKPTIKSLQVSLAGLAMDQREVLALRGESLSLEVTATSAATGALTYQWLRGGVVIAGQNPGSNTYTIDSVDLANAGSYSVRVIPPGIAASNAALTAVSDAVEVAVIKPVSSSLVVAGNSTLTLGSEVVGKGVTYAWFKGDQPLLADARLGGVNTSQLKLTGAALGDNGTYNCLVSMGGVRRPAAQHSLEVRLAPQFTQALPLVLPSAMVRSAVDWTLPVQAATRVVATGLPAGLVLDSASGRISGRPRVAAGSYNIRFTASNEYGSTSAAASMLITALPTALATLHYAVLDRSELNAGLGGPLSLNISGTGSCTGRLQLGPQTINFVRDIDMQTGSEATLQVPLATSSGAALGSLAVTLDSAAGIFTGRLTAPQGSAILPLDFEGYSRHWALQPTSTVNPYAGRQHLLLSTTGIGVQAPETKYPEGFTYAVIVVKRDGTYTLTGRMGDGEALSQSGFIGRQGQMGMFQALYTTAVKGSVVANLRLARGDNQSLNITGSGSWNRPANTSKNWRFYPRGFAPLPLAASGGKYNPPAAGQALIPSTDGAMVLRIHSPDGGITSPFGAVWYNLSTSNALSVRQIANTLSNPTASLNPSTGVFSGSIRQTMAPWVRTFRYEGLVIPAVDGNPNNVVIYGSFQIPALPSGAGQTLSNTALYQGGILFNAQTIPSP